MKYQSTNKNLEEPAGAATRESDRREGFVGIVDSTTCSELCVQVQTDGRRSLALSAAMSQVVEFVESVHVRPVGENTAMRGGEQRMLRGVHVSHHERSGAAILSSSREMV